MGSPSPILILMSTPREVEEGTVGCIYKRSEGMYEREECMGPKMGTTNLLLHYGKRQELQVQTLQRIHKG